MIRFVDLTDYYYCGVDDDESDPIEPLCAFLDVRTDKFVSDENGCHVFSDMEDIKSMLPYQENLVFLIRSVDAERLIGLVPEGFFDVNSEFSKNRRKRNKDA